MGPLFKSFESEVSKIRKLSVSYN